MEIITLGDEVLRKQAAVIPEVDRKIADLAAAMIESMHVGKGIGLAGPQVGELKRLFVVHVEADTPRVFINPQIIQTSNELNTIEEGCLSIPGMYSDVDRPMAITIQAWNERGRPFTLDAEGILARVIQHEFDHLNGVLFLDHIDEKKRNRIISQYGRRSSKLVKNP
ncbi:MAG: peptide deformylase [Spirochaetales bacterium]|nr:peptide deformylase [Spirochaetales bacterium]